MSSLKKNSRRKRRPGEWKLELTFHLMLLPAVILIIIFAYIPIAGNIMAFQDFRPFLSFTDSPFVGLDNFRFIFSLPTFSRAFRNTMVIAFWRTLMGLLVPLLLALLINEVLNNKFKRLTQTAMFLPFFLSWAVLGGVVRELFSLQGPINQIISAFGADPYMFMASNNWFRTILVSTATWQGMGINMVVFLAAVTNIDPGLYESASLDGCSKIKQVWYITLPGMLPIIVLLSTLALGGLLNAGFDQVLVLYNPLVYETGDVIDTLIYRVGLQNRQFSIAAAMGLFRSLVNLSLVGISYFLAFKSTGYRVF